MFWIKKLFRAQFDLEANGYETIDDWRADWYEASIIETCRRRGASSWQYLGTVIAAARLGLPLPALPAIPMGV